MTIPDAVDKFFDSLEPRAVAFSRINPLAIAWRALDWMISELHAYAVPNQERRRVE